MKKTFFIIFSLLILPVYAEYVNVEDTLNVRGSSSTEADVIDTLKTNHWVNVIKSSNEWVFVGYTKNQIFKTGWVKKSFLSKEKRKHVPKSSNNTLQYINKLNTLIEKQRCSEALNVANEFVLFYPDTAISHLWRSLVHFQLDDYQNTILDINKAMTISDYEILKQQEYFEDRTFTVLAFSHYFLNEDAQALKYFDKVDPSYISSLPFNARYNFYFFQGSSQLITQRYNKSIYNFTKALDIMITPDAYFCRASSYLWTGQYDLAKDDCYEVINLCRYDKSKECEIILSDTYEMLQSLLEK